MGFEIVAGGADELLATCSQSSMWARGKILVSNLDVDVSASDALTLAKKSMWPVVLETSDIYQRNLLELRKDSHIRIIQFQKAGVAELAGLLKKVCVAEGITCGERALYELAYRSDGDVRWVLVALESLKALNSEVIQELGKGKVERIFDALDATFQRRQSDTDVNDLVAWIVENLPDRYSGGQLAEAYHCVAAANRFQKLNLERTSREMMKMLPASRVAGIYRPPQWVGAASAAVGMHCSAKKAKLSLQLINKLQRKNVSDSDAK
jgi:hypothetical protein